MGARSDRNDSAIGTEIDRGLDRFSFDDVERLAVFRAVARPVGAGVEAVGRAVAVAVHRVIFTWADVATIRHAVAVGILVIPVTGADVAVIRHGVAIGVRERAIKDLAVVDDAVAVAVGGPFDDRGHVIAVFSRAPTLVGTRHAYASDDLHPGAGAHVVPVGEAPRLTRGPCPLPVGIVSAGEDVEVGRVLEYVDELIDEEILAGTRDRHQVATCRKRGGACIITLLERRGVVLVPVPVSAFFRRPLGRHLADIGYPGTIGIREFAIQDLAMIHDPVIVAVGGPFEEYRTCSLGRDGGQHRPCRLRSGSGIRCIQDDATAARRRFIGSPAGPVEDFTRHPVPVAITGTEQPDARADQGAIDLGPPHGVRGDVREGPCTLFQSDERRRVCATRIREDPRQQGRVLKDEKLIPVSVAAVLDAPLDRLPAARSVLDAAPAVAGLGLLGVFGTVVDAVGGAVIIGVGLGDAAAAVAGLGLVGVVGTVVDAVGGAVIVGVGLGDAAAAVTGLGLLEIVGTAVDAVVGAVTVGVTGLGHVAAAVAGFGLVGVRGTAVVAVGGAVTVRVTGLGYAAAAVAGFGLVGVRGTAVVAVVGAVTIGVAGFRHAASAFAGRAFRRIIGTAVLVVAAVITVGVAVGADAVGIRIEGAGIDAVHHAVTVAVHLALDAIRNAVIVLVAGFRSPAPTLTRERLLRVIRALVCAVGDAVTIGIGVVIDRSASTDTGLGLRRVEGTAVFAVAGPVVVVVVAATAVARFCSERVVGTSVGTVGDAVAVTVVLIGSLDGDLQGPRIKTT